MSYDIDLLDPVTGRTLQVETRHQMSGGTYQLGGSNDLSLNVTYNYGPHYRRVFAGFEVHRNAPDWMKEESSTSNDKTWGIRVLYGYSAAETIPMLEKAIAQLGDDVSENYWDATEGNAKRALIQLKAMAQMRPDGVWMGD